MFGLSPAENVKSAIANAKHYAISTGSNYIAIEHLLMGVASVESVWLQKS